MWIYIEINIFYIRRMSAQFLYFAVHVCGWSVCSPNQIWEFSMRTRLFPCSQFMFWLLKHLLKFVAMNFNFFFCSLLLASLQFWCFSRSLTLLVYYEVSFPWLLLTSAVSILWMCVSVRFYSIQFGEKLLLWKTCRHLAFQMDTFEVTVPYILLF